MKAAESAGGQFSKGTQANLRQLGGDMQALGGRMTAGLTVPIVAAGAGAVKLSMDFETAFSRMVGLADVPAQEVDRLKASVLELAGETGQAPVALANALYEAASAGLDAEGALAATGMAARAAASGMGSAKDIVGLIASATNAYGKENVTAASAVDILTQTIREGRADPEELAGSLGSLLPVAAQMGISFAEVGAAVAFTTNIMGNTDRALTAINDMLTKLATPADAAKTKLTEMGTSAEELRAAIAEDGLMGALNLLREHGFQGNLQAIRAIMPDMQGMKALSGLLADESGTLGQTMLDVAGSVGAADSAFQTASQTGAHQMKVAWAEMQVALIEAGNIIAPVVADIVGGIGKLVGAFAGLPAPVQTVVVGFLGFVAAAGPMIVIAGTLIKNLGYVVTALKALSAASLISWPVALAAAVAVAGAALISFATQTSDAEKHMQAAKETADELTSSMMQTGPIEALRAHFTGLATDNEAFRKSLVGSGVTIDDLALAAARGDNMVLGFQRRLIEGAGAAGVHTDQIQDLADVLAFELYEGIGMTRDRIGEMEVAQGNATSTSAGWALALEREADALAETATGAGWGADAMDLFGSSTSDAVAPTEEMIKAQEELAQKIADARKMAQDYALVLSGSDWGGAAFTAGQTAMAGFSGNLLSLRQLASDAESAFDAFGATLSEEVDGNVRQLAFNMDATTEAGRRQIDAVAGIASVLDTQFANAYANAGGDLETFKATATEIGEQTLTRLASELQLSAEETELLRSSLGLTAGDYEARFTLSGAEEARVKLDLLSGVMGQLDEGVQAEITQKIIEGDWQGALALLQSHLDANNVNSTLYTITDAASLHAAKGAVTGVAKAPYNATINVKEVGAAAAAGAIAGAASGSGWGGIGRAGLAGGAAGAGGYRATINTSEMGSAAVAGTLRGVANARYGATITASLTGEGAVRAALAGLTAPRTVTIRAVTVGAPVPRAGGGTVGRNEPFTLVGEDGPEIATFPPGTHITPAAETARLMSPARDYGFASAAPRSVAPVATGGDEHIHLHNHHRPWGSADLSRAIRVTRTTR